MTDRPPENPEPHVPVDRGAKALGCAGSIVVSAVVCFAIVVFCLKGLFQ